MSEKIQDSLVIPTGTNVVVVDNSSKFNGKVGVIVLNPYDDVQYNVRFPDRGEHRFSRKQLKYRKNIQKEGLTRPTPPEVMRENMIYYCVVGSTAYGMAIEGSDKDYRGIYLAPAEYHWSLWGAAEHFEFHEPEDEQVYELENFLKLALKSNPNILEILSTSMVLKTTEIGLELVKNRKELLSKIVYDSYNGYALSQFKKLEQDIRSFARKYIQENKLNFPDERIINTPINEVIHELNLDISEAIRWKHAAHLIRLLISGVHILNYGEVLVDVGPWREELVAIRNKQVQWDKVDKWRLELHKKFDEAKETTLLPDRPNFHWANQFLISARESRARDYFERKG